MHKTDFIWFHAETNSKGEITGIGVVTGKEFHDKKNIYTMRFSTYTVEEVLIEIPDT